MGLYIDACLRNQLIQLRKLEFWKSCLVNIGLSCTEWILIISKACLHLRFLLWLNFLHLFRPDLTFYYMNLTPPIKKKKKKKTMHCIHTLQTTGWCIKIDYQPSTSSLKVNEHRSEKHKFIFLGALGFRSISLANLLSNEAIFWNYQLRIEGLVYIYIYKIFSFDICVNKYFPQ